jgi:hypothetical protein
MRRLAKQRRDDAYASNRDYQTIEAKRATAITLKQPNRKSERFGQVVFRAALTAPANTTVVGFGGFILPESPMIITVKLSAGKASRLLDFPLQNAWNRIGVTIDAPDATDAMVALVIPVNVPISVWGLNVGRVNLPEPAHTTAPTLDVLQGAQIAPETFYLPHDVTLPIEIDAEASDRFEISHGRTIGLKKCSYCQRLLPVDPDRIGTLSFHKHNAKKTNHQNECRSCKKWRINNNFNPKRTVDQLNESSLITRERKIFLREPQILQEIKDRTGDGLKSQVWIRFGKKCFYCERPLQLSEVQLDHTRPLAYLWPIDVHATCLCADHNNLKKDKFPSDFYNEGQLRRLSEICGLPYDLLAKRELNDQELRRIISDLPRFAVEWDARTFAATARKIIELRPDVDLVQILAERAPAIHLDLIERLRERPPSVTEEEE